MSELRRVLLANATNTSNGGVSESDIFYDAEKRLLKGEGIVDDAGVIYAFPTSSTVSGGSEDEIIATQSYVDNAVANDGGSSNANVQAVDTGDIVDDVNVDYATTAYVNDLVGDINSILESIISGGGSVSLITFTVSGTEYQAEEGMTWEEFINSEYNTSGFIADNGFVLRDANMPPYNIYNDSSTTRVEVSDIIINGHSYVALGPGAGS